MEMVVTKTQQPKLHHGYTRQQLKMMSGRELSMEHPFFYATLADSMRNSMKYWLQRVMSNDNYTDHGHSFRHYMKCRRHYKTFLLHWKQFNRMPLPLP